MTTKTCIRCGTEYPATIAYFNRNGRSDDTLRAKCKVCEHAYRLENKSKKYETDKAYRNSHKEELSIKKAKYRKEHKEEEAQRYQAWMNNNREHYLQYQRGYWGQRKDEKREYDKQYREKNRDKITARQKRWILDNIDHARLKSRSATSRYIARKRNAKGNYTPDDVKRMYKAQHGKCYYCHKKLDGKYHVDHVIPLSRGGSNSPDNLVIACVSCNVRKSARMPHEWLDGGRLF